MYRWEVKPDAHFMGRELSSWQSRLSKCCCPLWHYELQEAAFDVLLKRCLFMHAIAIGILIENFLQERMKSKKQLWAAICREEERVRISASTLLPTCPPQEQQLCRWCNQNGLAQGTNCHCRRVHSSSTQATCEYEDPLSLDARPFKYFNKKGLGSRGAREQKGFSFLLTANVLPEKERVRKGIAKA